MGEMTNFNSLGCHWVHASKLGLQISLLWALGAYVISDYRTLVNFIRRLPPDFHLVPQTKPTRNSDSRTSSNQVGSNALLRPPVQTSAASSTKRSVSSSTEYYTTSACVYFSDIRSSAYNACS